MFGLGMHELMIVGIVAILLFGKRLPEVARSLGKSYNEFRRGLNDIQTSIDTSDTYRASSSSYASSHPAVDEGYEEEPAAPRFEPPASEPQVSETVAEEKTEATS